MDWISGLAVYFIIWWLVIFMVLPFGAGPTIGADDVAKGQAAGAPEKARLPMKMMVTTVISGIIFGAFYWSLETGLIAFGGV